MENTSYERIMENIKAQLTGDKEHDKQIIISSMNEYAEHEYAKEITRELGRILYDYLTAEERESFEKVAANDIPERKLLESVENDLNNNQFEEAFEKLDDFVNNWPKRFVDDSVSEYHIFQNDMEIALFEKLLKASKEVRIIPPDVPIPDLYFLYSYLLVEQNRLDEAEKYLKVALNYNPLSSNVIFELLDIYKRKGDWENMEKYINMALEYSYTPPSLARAYREIGYLNVELKNLELSVASYIHSLKYDNNELAYAELQFLKDQGANIDITSQDAVEILEENNIQLVANPIIVEEHIKWGDEFAENDELEKAVEMYAIAYALDDSIKNQLRYKTAEAALNGDTQVNINL